LFSLFSATLGRRKDIGSGAPRLLLLPDISLSISAPSRRGANLGEALRPAGQRLQQVSGQVLDESWPLAERSLYSTPSWNASWMSSSWARDCARTDLAEGARAAQGCRDGDGITLGVEEATLSLAISKRAQVSGSTVLAF
jgi:hypothetical protein